MHHSPTTKASPNGSKPVYPRQPIGTIAAMIAKRVSEGTKPLIYIAETGRRRQDIFRLASLLSKPGSVCEFMAPDGFPGDGLPVTAAIAGNRMAMLRWLRDPDNRPSVVITTPAALIRKVPPRSSTNETHLEIAVGETIDVETLKSRLSSLGYWLDDVQHLQFSANHYQLKGNNDLLCLTRPELIKDFPAKIVSFPRWQQFHNP